jgi:transposase
MSGAGNGDAEKARYWQRTISEAARSGISIREFCRRRRVKESQFYWWQHKLKAGRDERTMRRPGLDGKPASFALVSEAEPGASDVGIELVLGDGRKLRIRHGVDEATLRAVLAALEPPRC